MLLSLITYLFVFGAKNSTEHIPKPQPTIRTSGYSLIKITSGTCVVCSCQVGWVRD